MNTRLVLGLLFLPAVLIQAVQAEDNHRQFITQPTTVLGDAVVGAQGTNNFLAILLEGTLTNNSSVIGEGPAAHGNRAIVTGPEAAWHNHGSITVGRQSGGNSLEVRDGGQLISGIGTIGDGLIIGAPFSSNDVIIDGPGSQWRTERLAVGRGAESALSVTGGGILDTWGLYLASGSTVLVSGPGSRMNIRSLLDFQPYSSMNNQLRITHGGVVTANSVFLSHQAENNTLVVHGAGSRLEVTNTLAIGIGNPRFLIQEGGEVVTSWASVGGSPRSVQVSGAGSCFRVTSSLSLNGDIRTTNNFLVSSGGELRVKNNDASSVFNIIRGFNLNIDGGTVEADNLTTLEQTGVVRLIAGSLSVHRMTLATSLKGPFAIGDCKGQAEFYVSGRADIPMGLVVSTGGVFRLNGTIRGNVGNNGMIARTTSNTATIEGNLTNTAKFHVLISLQAGMPTVRVTKTASLAGELTLDLHPEVPVERTSKHLILEAGNIVGRFHNAPDGSRVRAGKALFRIDYSATSVTLSDPIHDADFDGIGDAWALQFFGHSPLTLSERAEDSDQDGASNYEEFLANTDPFDASSVLKLMPDQEGERFVLSFRHVPGRRHELLGSSNLISWSAVETEMRVVSGRGHFENLSVGPGPMFYRLAVF